MAYTQRIAPLVAPHLAEGERLSAAVRANPKGCHAVNGSIAGIVAAVGFVIGITVGDGYLGAVIGGAVGAVAGVLIAYVYATIRVRRVVKLEAPNLALALTDRRLLVFVRSALTNRIRKLSLQYPLDEVRSVTVGEPKLIFPPPMWIVSTEGRKLSLEVGRIDDPEGFAAAFAAARGS